MEMDRVAIILGFIRPSNTDLLLNAIKGIKAQTYKNFDIFVYDNSELKDSLQELKTQFPDVHIKKNIKNNGFTGGNNGVMREVINKGIYKYIVLLNDDTNPNKEWLENLIKAKSENENAGAITSKLLFYEQYIRVVFETETFNPKILEKSHDDRDLGIRYFADSKLSSSNYNKAFLRSGGFYGYEYSADGNFTWTKDKFVVDYPIGNSSVDKYTLLLHVSKPIQIKDQELKIKVGDFEKIIKLEYRRK